MKMIRLLMMIGIVGGLFTEGLAFDLTPGISRRGSSRNGERMSLGGSSLKHTASPFVGKRYMCDEEGALESYKKRLNSLDRTPSQENPQVLRDKGWEKFFTRYVAPLYVKAPTGEIVQVAEWENNGTLKKQRFASKECAPVTVDEFLPFCKNGMLFAYPSTEAVACMMCDGNRYVIYLPEEVKAVKAYQKRYHGQHDGHNDRGYDSDEYKEQERLREQAPNSGWEDSMGVMPCCWTKVHEGATSAFKHPCPICKGKKTQRVKCLKFCELQLKENPKRSSATVKLVPLSRENIGTPVVPGTEEVTLPSSSAQEQMKKLSPDDDDIPAEKRHLLLHHKKRPHPNSHDNCDFWLARTPIRAFEFVGSFQLGTEPGCVLSIGSEYDSLQLWRGQSRNMLEIRIERDQRVARFRIENGDRTNHLYRIVCDGRTCEIYVNGKELYTFDANPIPLPLYGIQQNKPLGVYAREDYGKGCFDYWSIYRYEPEAD